MTLELSNIPLINKISFHILGEKGLITLNAVLNNFPNIIGEVIYAEDSKIQNDYSNEIKSVCISANIQHYNRSIKKQTDFKFILTIGWKWLINKKDEQTIFVIHDSLLPKYRGFAPVVNALINGESKIGATLIIASNEYDTGNIIAQKSINIKYPIKINTAIKLISELYIDLTLDLVKLLAKNSEISGREQDHTKASYSLWRDEKDYFINWNNDALYIKRFVDAVGYPYLGAKTRFHNYTLTILEVDSLPDVCIENRTNGKQIFSENGLPIIVCGKGLIKIIAATENGSPFVFNTFRNRFF